MAEILFTCNDRWGSRLIRAVTDESVSHCAIRVGVFVVHSRLTSGGVVIEPYKKFLRENEIVYRLTPNVIPGVERVISSYSRLYDLGGIFFLGFRLLLRKYLGIPVPKVNLWQSTGMLMCTEYVLDSMGIERDSMITPYKLYKKLRSATLN